MKQIIILFLVLSAFKSFGQSTAIDTSKWIDNNGSVDYWNGRFRNALIIPSNEDTSSKIAGQVKRIRNKIFYSGEDNHWHELNTGSSSSGGSIDTLRNGGAITSLPTIGFNPGTTNIAQWITNTYYASQPPTAALTGGVTLELMAAGSPLTQVVNWTAGRQSATATISSITVQGVSKTFSQPAAGTTVSGTHNATITRNVNTTVSLVVTTTDSKTAPATTDFIFSPKRYFGWVNSTTPSDAEILATSSEFSTLNYKSWSQTQPTGYQNLMYAKPANQGPITEIFVNAIPSIESFEHIQRTLTNALGYSQLYDIYVTINQSNKPGNTDVVAQ